MSGHVYVVHGDITKCKADAIAFSTSTKLGGTGKLYSSFAALDGFSEAYSGLKGRPWNVGDTHWIPASTKQPGIVVAFSIDWVAKEPAAQAAMVVRNAVRCAVDNLRSVEPLKRLLILLPTFLTGAGGARRMRSDLARVQIAAAKEAVAELPSVDVGFVLFNPSDHHVFRDARRELLRGIVPGAIAPDVRLVDAVRRGECVVFVGSGLSVGAGMKGWGALIEHLRAPIADLVAGPSSNTDEHLQIAQRYRDVTHARQLTPLRCVVRELFGPAKTPKPTLCHYLLASLGARNVITTNYDHLLETTLQALRQKHLAVVEPRHVPETGNLDGVNVVKFHGDAEHGDDVIASTQDYALFFENHPVFDLLLSGLLLNQTFLFVGYGLTDPNFRHIYARIARLLGAAQRPVFATSFGAPQQPIAGVNVVQFDGSIEQQTQLLQRWFDDLVDAAAEPESVLLADAANTAHVSPADLVELRARLLAVGSEVTRLATEPLGAADTRTVARIARALIEHGWRSSVGNERILEHLASKLTSLEEQRTWLRVALAHADSQDAVARLESLLEQCSVGGVG